MAGPAAAWDDPGACLLAFSLGPVQSFIASARSARDLWTGSFLLSWLTRRAMEPIRERHGAGAFVMPALEGNPLQDLEKPADHDRPPASLPNRFLALVPGGEGGGAARALATECRTRCRDAWEEVCEAVRVGIGQRVRELDPDWDRWWDAQVGDFFEIHTAVLPFAACDEAMLRGLLGSAFDASRPHKLGWGRMHLAARLLAAQRAAGHQPAYRAHGDVPQKCSLLGTYEQMGPATYDESGKFWEQLARRCEWKGTRIRRNERLCAISLVKRFAWPGFLSPRLGLLPQAGYYPDTATVAAAAWVCQEPSVINPIEERARPGGDWSGQWLHWPRREGPRRRQAGDPDHDPPPREELWRHIVAKRADQGPAPAYLAILRLDGDRMGQWLRGDRTPEVHPEALSGAISRVLGRFSGGAAREIVEGHHSGTLIYAGGDDFLAFLPTRTALACARELRERFTAAWDEQLGELGGGPVTVSAGIAVVHHKEDLRFALHQARRAEEAAKSAGRDALALAICRRSGEHSSVVVPWDLVGRLEGWIDRFRGRDGQQTGEGASDRWLYALRAESPTLQGEDVPWGAVEAEVGRLAGRAEDGDRRIEPDDAVKLLRAYREAMHQRPEVRRGNEILDDYVALGQAASFLARGRD